MKTVQTITAVQDFLDNKIHIRTAMLVKTDGKVYITLKDKKRGQTLVAKVEEIIKPEEPIF